MNDSVRGRGRWGAAFLVVALMATTLVACGRSSGGGKATSGKKGAPATAPGFDGTTITLGAITPQTGIAAIIGNPLTAGNQVYVDALNARGGIAGKYKVKLVVSDSQYDENTAVQVFNGMKDNVAAIVQSLGTAITNALLPLLTQDNIVASPATLDAEWVRQPNLIPIGGPYQIQAINAMDYYVTEGGGKGKTVCVARQDDPYGEAGLGGIEFAAKKLDFKVGTIVTFKATASDFTGQLQQLEGGHCDAVFLVALPTATLAIFPKAAADNFTPQWIGQAPTWVSLLATGSTLDYAQKHFWVASEGPQWGDTSVPGMKQLLGDIATSSKPDQKPDIYFAFGYAQAWAVSQVLEKAVALGDLSRAGIKKALTQVGTLKFGGLLGDYVYGPPNNRVPPHSTSIFKVDPSAPGALAALKVNFTSPPAQEFKFPKA